MSDGHVSESIAAIAVSLLNNFSSSVELPWMWPRAASGISIAMRCRIGKQLLPQLPRQWALFHFLSTRFCHVTLVIGLLVVRRLASLSEGLAWPWLGN